MNRRSFQTAFILKSLWKRVTRQSLTVKLIFTVSSVVCLIVAVGTVMLMEVTRKEIAETSVTTALYQTQVLKNKLLETMISEDSSHDGLMAMLNNRDSSFAAYSANIFDRRGKITFSSDPGLIGTRTRAAELRSDRMTSDNSAVVFTDMGKEGQLRIMHPVRGGRQCVTCHAGEAGEVIGGIELLVPLGPVYRRFAMNRFLLIFAAFAIILLSALLIRWLVHRIVKGPIKKLRKVMEAAERGELDVRSQIHEDPDLRKLARSFNEMVLGIQKAQVRVAQQYQKELAQSNRLASLGQFVSTISHEIKNPLAAISSTIHALRDEFRTEEDRIIFQELNGQLERIERTVNNLLRFARQAPPQLENCDVLKPIDEALHLAAGRFKEAGIRVGLDTKTSARNIEADSGQLEQVFLNLFLNSADAMPGGGQISITIGADAPLEKDTEERFKAEGIWIEVSDTGRGIERGDLDKIFEPFYSSKKGGTGLGLSVVKGIVEAHGGTILASSELGKGTKISLKFLRKSKRMFSDMALASAYTRTLEGAAS